MTNISPPSNKIHPQSTSKNNLIPLFYSFIVGSLHLLHTKTSKHRVLFPSQFNDENTKMILGIENHQQLHFQKKLLDVYILSHDGQPFTCTLQLHSKKVIGEGEKARYSFCSFSFFDVRYDGKESMFENIFSTKCQDNANICKRFALYRDRSRIKFSLVLGKRRRGRIRTWRKGKNKLN